MYSYSGKRSIEDTLRQIVIVDCVIYKVIKSKKFIILRDLKKGLECSLNVEKVQIIECINKWLPRNYS